MSVQDLILTGSRDAVVDRLRQLALSGQLVRADQPAQDNGDGTWSVTVLVVPAPEMARAMALRAATVPARQRMARAMRVALALAGTLALALVGTVALALWHATRMALAHPGAVVGTVALALLGAGAIMKRRLTPRHCPGCRG